MSGLYRCRKVGFDFGRIEALREIDLAIERGEILGIVGPNGAGKSTLIKLLAGILTGFRGDIQLEDRSLEDWSRPELARKIAFVPQEMQIVFPFSVEEVVLMGRHPHRRTRLFDSPEDREVVRQILEKTGCLPLRDRYFNELSGGEKQLTVLASCLAQEPEILFLDEPTVHLDVRHQLHIFDVLRREHERNGKTLVIVTHDLNLATRFCRRIVYIKQGRIIAEQSRPFELEPALIREVFEVDAQSLEEGKVLLSFGGEASP